MCRSAIVAFLVLLSAISQTQASEPDTCFNKANEKPYLAPFVPKGWEVLCEAEGDLNADRRADFALILRGTDPRQFAGQRYRVNLNPKLLIVGFAEGSGYKIVVRNDKVIPVDEVWRTRAAITPSIDYSAEYGVGDLQIRRGRLFLDVYMEGPGGTSNDTELGFLFYNSEFRLVQSTNNSTSRDSFLDGEIDYLSRRVRVEDGEVWDLDPRKPTPAKVIVGRLPAGPLLTLDQIGDIEAQSFREGRKIILPLYMKWKATRRRHQQ